MYLVGVLLLIVCGLVLNNLVTKGEWASFPFSRRHSML